MTSPKALRDWCRLTCAGYPNVEIRNMSTSFRDGLVFCAIIHRHRPDLLDFSLLSRDNAYQNNKLAFEIAETKLGIPALLDPSDLLSSRVPDCLSIITYLYQYYHFFTRKSYGPVSLKTSHVTVLKSKTRAGLKPRKSLTDLKISGEDCFSSSRPRTVCSLCFKPVHLIQRYLIDGKVYHRSCFRCRVCHSTLLPGSYTRGSEAGVFFCSHHTGDSLENWPKSKSEEGYFSLGGSLISSIPHYTKNTETQERLVPETAVKELQEKRDREDFPVELQSKVKKPARPHRPPTAEPEPADRNSQQEVRQTEELSECSSLRLQASNGRRHPVPAPRRMLNPSAAPVPSPRNKSNGSPTAGNTRDQNKRSPASSHVSSPSSSRGSPKVRTNHPWLNIVHPGPWTQLPPAPAPIPAPRTKFSARYRPRDNPPNPFAEDMVEDAVDKNSPADALNPFADDMIQESVHRGRPKIDPLNPFAADMIQESVDQGRHKIDALNPFADDMIQESVDQGLPKVDPTNPFAEDMIADTLDRGLSRTAAPNPFAEDMVEDVAKEDVDRIAPLIPFAEETVEEISKPDRADQAKLSVAAERLEKDGAVRDKPGHIDTAVQPQHAEAAAEGVVAVTAAEGVVAVPAAVGVVAVPEEGVVAVPAAVGVVAVPAAEGVVTVPAAEGAVTVPAEGVVAVPAEGVVAVPAEGVVAVPAEGGFPVPAAVGVVAVPVEGVVAVPAAVGVVAVPAAEGVVAVPAAVGVVAVPAEEVVAVPAAEGVVAVPAAEGVVTVPAAEGVVAVPAEGVVTVPAAEGVVAVPAKEGMVAVPAEGVVTVPAAEGVVTVPAAEGVVAVPAAEGAVAVPAKEGMVAVPATEGAVSVPAAEGVVAVPAEEGMVAVPAAEGVVTVPAAEGVVAVPAKEGMVAVPAAEGVVTVTAVSLTVGTLSQSVDDVNKIEVMVQPEAGNMSCSLQNVIETSVWMSEAPHEAQCYILPRSLSVPAMTSSHCYSSSLPVDLIEAQGYGQVSSSESKLVCKENPFDRKSGMPKSKTFQSLPSRRGTAPGHGFPLIRRKVQTDQNVSTEDLRSEMREVDEHLQTLEQRGVQLERNLRDCKNDQQEEHMLAEWFSLVREKNSLVRRDTELIHLAKQQRLEERQADVEYELRCLLNKPEGDWSEEDRSHEQQLMDELVTIIEERNEIISNLDQDRLREQEEDMFLDTMKTEKELQKEGLKDSKKAKGKFKPKKVFKLLNH
ncbi:MICAL-like protein 1 isoform X2 [Halichoeres trimaculatus]|uniref:MICAL-like protein 1 isoform X2 n=1 Tax=Halichoeres trimaculatus TaxID=147232 RepID=UPI003D9EDDDD